MGFQDTSPNRWLSNISLTVTRRFETETLERHRLLRKQNYILNFLTLITVDIYNAPQATCFLTLL
jgi:hypothetical protein